jgi:tetratricopeptide (TPR) repeat protein
MEDAYEEWAQEYRTTLMAEHLEALEGAATAALAAGLGSDAASLAQIAAAREPLRESCHLLLARSLAGVGDTAGALSCLRVFRLRLAEELGLDPTSAVSDLEQELLRGQAVATVRTSETPSEHVVPVELPFAGREQEVETILAVLHGSGYGTVLISGPAGSGKSRLVLEAARRLSRPIIFGRAFAAEADEPWSLARTLVQEALALFPDAAQALPVRTAKALAEVVPEIVDDLITDGAPIDAQSRRALALQGAARVMEETVSSGAIVVVDDLQWSDPTSLACLGTASRLLGSLPLIVAYRPEEVDRGGAVASFLSDQLQNSVATIELDALSPAAISQLFVAPELAQAVVDETDGTPLAVAELIRTLASGGVVGPEPGNRWGGRTDDAIEQARKAAQGGKIRAIEARLLKLPVSANEVLGLLALLGHPAPARILAKASKVDQTRILDDLELLARKALVHLVEEGWAPAHDLIGEAIVRRLGPEDRGRLHGLLASALNEDESDPSELARHLAGAGDKRAAAEAFADAGRRALDRFASEEAEALANSGLDLEPDTPARSELFEVRAEARARRGQITAAREDLRAALVGKQGPERSLILARLALLISGAEDYLQAGTLVDIALAEAGSDVPARARALAVGAMLEGNMNHLERAERLAAEALELFQRLEDGHGVADILELQGLNMIYAGRIAEGVTMLGRVARLFQDAGKLLRIGPAICMQALGLRCMRRFDEALRELDHTLGLEEELGSPEGKSLCLSARALVLADLDRHADGKQVAEEALAIARRIGHRELKSMALLNLGYTLRAARDLEGTTRVWEECIREAHGLPAYLCFAHGGMASVQFMRGDLDGAEAHLQRAFEAGFPFALYDARLVHAELLVARKEAGAAGTIAEYLAMAESGGHLLSATRLRELLDKAGTRPLGKDEPIPKGR